MRILSLSLIATVALTGAAHCTYETRFLAENPSPDGPPPGATVPQPAPSGSYGASTSTAGGAGGAFAAVGGASSTGGQGGLGGSPLEGPCPEAQRLCSHLFTYSTGGESLVAVAGDFTVPPWEVQLPMVLSGETWSLETSIPWDTHVQYKLVLNGTTWISDPANPLTVNDTFGGQNSLLLATTCPDSFSCSEP